jgi:hypothetical protein
MRNQTTSLVEQFIARTLPKARWTHEAHLRVGLWHVLNHGAVDAMTLLRERIRAYNESVGTQNTETSGYHETITQFYVLIIDKFLAHADRQLPMDELSALLLENYGERELALQYYSREVLFSANARLNWVEPDRRLID